MLRPRARFVAALGVILALAGVPACSSSDAPSSGEVEQRIALLDDVAADMEALFAANPQPSPDELHALLASRPELVETGASDDGAWGRFADGRLVFLLDDRTGGAEATDVTPKSTSTPDLIPYGQPVGIRVQIFDAMGSLFKHYWRDFEPWFERAGYVTNVGLGSVEEMKQVSGNAVLYVNAHGGRQSVGGETLAFVSTATPIGIGFELLYEPDLRDRALVYMLVKHDLLPNGKITVARLYGFTQRFVTKYMELEPESLVVADACRSMSSEMAEAFMAKGASLYAGWSERVNDRVSQPAVELFFDRLLGENAVQPVSPPQRPFNYIEVLADMAGRGLDRGLDTRGRTTTFSVYSGGNLGLLAPSLKHVTLNAVDPTQSVLMLNGSFGTIPGRVRVNGYELACSDWFEDVVICPVAASGASGVGQVVVDSRGIASNARSLTEWRGSLTFTGKYGCGPGSPRNLVATVRADMRLRADVGGFREHSGEAPVLEPIQFNLERPPTVFVTGTGQCSHQWPGLALETTRWSGTAEVPWDDEHSLGVVDVARRRIRLHLEVRGGNAIQYATTCDGSLCAQGTVDVSWKTGDDGFADGDDPFAGAVIDIPLDGALNGIAGSKQGPVPADYGWPQASLSWTTLTASSPPDPNARQ